MHQGFKAKVHQGFKARGGTGTTLRRGRPWPREREGPAHLCVGGIYRKAVPVLPRANCPYALIH